MSLPATITGPSVWYADTVVDNDGIVAIEAATVTEMRAAVEVLKANPLEITALSPDDFELPLCRQLMSAVKRILDDGVGFVILDGLPVDQWSIDESKALEWLLMSLLGRTVAQTWTGTLLYDVLDTGRKEELGAGVRGSKTNGRQGFHTDNSYNLPPDYVGLLCLRSAKAGGVSGLVSFAAAHNRLLERDSTALSRLFEPFYFERYKEFAPGESAVAKHSVFSDEDGRLGVRLSNGRVRTGYRAANEAMDEVTEHALAALDAVLEDPELGKTFEFLPGQLQIVNNRKIGHRRTAFEDWPEVERRRHLVRVWVRNRGRRFYAG
jgi:alpha-ketoglutarate-dependent taurine dioxygenase